MLRCIILRNVGGEGKEPIQLPARLFKHESMNRIGFDSILFIFLRVGDHLQLAI